MSNYKIEFSEHFTSLYDELSELEQDLIEDFVFHFKARGLKDFKGKVAPTDNVPAPDPDRVHKIWWANRHHLYHAHIGYPAWNASLNPLRSYETSDYVVHFQKFASTFIALVDYGSHNPMLQPSREALFRH